MGYWFDDPFQHDGFLSPAAFFAVHNARAFSVSSNWSAQPVPGAPPADGMHRRLAQEVLPWTPSGPAMDAYALAPKGCLLCRRC